MNDIFEQTAALDGLTGKQKEVLALVAEGMTSKEIARKLRISESAVNQRIEVIRQRLGGMPRTQIARLYRRMSTVVLTVPTSNPVTGKSIQLLDETMEGQPSAWEGREVSTQLSQATNLIGSQPSTQRSTTFFSALDGSSGRWFQAVALLGVILAVIATVALLVDIATGLRDLLSR